MAELKKQPSSIGVADLEDELQAGPLPSPVEVSNAARLGDAIELAKEESGPPLRSLFFNRDYMLLWSGQVISTLGSGMSGFVLPLLILAITNSPAAAGFAGALFFVPYVIFSLPVGALMDRWDRKRVMIICDTVRAINIATIPLALYFNGLTVWQLYVNSFIEGSCFVFFNIAETAALPRVVDKRQLPAATAQNEAAFGIVGLISPAVGGFFYQSVSRVFPFIFDAISYSASVIGLSLIRTRFQEERKAGEQRNLSTEIKEGLAWLWSHALIRTIAFLTGGSNFVNASNGLIIILLAKRLGANEGGIGLIFSVASVGGIVGAVLGGFIQKRFRFGQVIGGTIWVQAIMFPLLLLAPHPILIGVVAALMFMVSPIYNITQFSYRMALIPDRLQGRVNSSIRLIAWGSQPFGAAIGGVMLEQAGVEVTVAILSACLFLAAIVAVTNHEIRHAKPIEQVQALA